jgi:hypothetical protein
VTPLKPLLTLAVQMMPIIRRGLARGAHGLRRHHRHPVLTTRRMLRPTPRTTAPAGLATTARQPEHTATTRHRWLSSLPAARSRAATRRHPASGAPVPPLLYRQLTTATPYRRLAIAALRRLATAACANHSASVARRRRGSSSVPTGPTAPAARAAPHALTTLLTLRPLRRTRARAGQGMTA